MSTPVYPTEKIHRITQEWLRERDQMAVKDLVVVILTFQDATAQSDPIGWLWKTLAHGELKHRRNGGRR